MEAEHEIASVPSGRGHVEAISDMASNCDPLKQIKRHIGYKSFEGFYEIVLGLLEHEPH